MRKGFTLKDVQVHTDAFIESHGIEPKGWGGWLFSLAGGPEDSAKNVQRYTGTYAAARNMARAEANRRGSMHIWVLP